MVASNGVPKRYSDSSGHAIARHGSNAVTHSKLHFTSFRPVRSMLHEPRSLTRIERGLYSPNQSPFGDGFPTRYKLKLNLNET